MLKFPWGIRKGTFSEQLNIELGEGSQADYGECCGITVRVVVEPEGGSQETVQ